MKTIMVIKDHSAQFCGLAGDHNRRVRGSLKRCVSESVMPVVLEHPLNCPVAQAALTVVKENWAGVGQVRDLSGTREIPLTMWREQGAYRESALALL